MEGQENSQYVVAQQVEGSLLGSPDEIKIATFYGQKIIWTAVDEGEDANIIARKKYQQWRSANLGRGLTIVSVDAQNFCSSADNNVCVISVIVVKYRGVATYLP